MGFIRCEEDCIFQKEGYCGFDKLTDSAVELADHHSCVYYQARDRGGTTT